MMEMKQVIDDLFYNFYTTERKGAAMSDGGGPFGFDIHFALEIDFLIKRYDIKEFVETGSNTGDTTEYLARTYPDIKIITSEIKPELFDYTERRLRKYDNVECYFESSQDVIQKYCNNLSNPFYYLDAHGYSYWPLVDEIKRIAKGVVCVCDFNIYHSKYMWDRWNGIHCDENLIRHSGVKSQIYSNNPNSDYQYPLLQRQRLSGRGYFIIGDYQEYFLESDHFRKLWGTD
jgi:hypothetical protein